MHDRGANLFFPGVDGPMPGGGTVDDDRELVRSLRYRRRAEQLERKISELLIERGEMLEKIRGLETAVEFQRRHIAVIQRKEKI